MSWKLDKSQEMSIYGLLCGILRIVHGNGVPFDHRSLAGLRTYERTTLDQERAVTKSLGSVNATFCLLDENYHTESKPKLDLHVCNKKKSSDIPMFTGQMENCVFNFY